MKKFGLVFILLLMLLSVVYFSLGIKHQIPEAVYGKWVTNHAQYKDRFFMLTNENVIFGVGDGNETAYYLNSIEKHIEKGQIFYTVIFEDDAGDSYQQSFYFDENSPGIIRFKNQKEIKWHKRG